MCDANLKNLFASENNREIRFLDARVSRTSHCDHINIYRMWRTSFHCSKRSAADL